MGLMPYAPNKIKPTMHIVIELAAIWIVVNAFNINCGRSLCKMVKYGQDKRRENTKRFETFTKYSCYIWTDSYWILRKFSQILKKKIKIHVVASTHKSMLYLCIAVLCLLWSWWVKYYFFFLFLYFVSFNFVSMSQHCVVFMGRRTVFTHVY